MDKNEKNVESTPSWRHPEAPLAAPVTPVSQKSEVKEEPKLKKRRAGNAAWRNILLVLVCLVAGFGGAWVFSVSGLDDNDTFTSTNQQVTLQEEELVAEVAKNVSPSVVSIISDVAPQSVFDRGGQGAGTGIIISEDGYVITNKHVVPEGSRNVMITLSDGTEYDDVDIIGRDPLNDLAFLKIKNPENFQAAKIGDSSQVAVGQKVVAIGNALGEFQNTVTSGIISGLGRPVAAQSGEEIEQLSNLFQTDTAINPGNSGGPLLNLRGEVIGINTAIAEESEGIGFAIPINAGRGLIEGVLENGKVQRSYLGVQYIDITPSVVEDEKLDGDALGGALVSGQTGEVVIKDSPADKAGLKSGDVILEVNNDEVSQGNSLSLLISLYRPGEEVALSVLRDGETIEVKVTLGEYQD